MRFRLASILCNFDQNFITIWYKVSKPAGNFAEDRLFVLLFCRCCNTSQRYSDVWMFEMRTKKGTPEPIIKDSNENWTKRKFRKRMNRKTHKKQWNQYGSQDSIYIDWCVCGDWINIKSNPKGSEKHWKISMVYMIYIYIYNLCMYIYIYTLYVKYIYIYIYID